MANRRTLHKKISLCEQLADVSDLAKLAYTWGILHADDWGVIKASPRGFKAEVLPLNDAPPSDVATALDELVSVRLVVRYSVGGVPHLWFPTFDVYQDGLHKRTERNRLPMPTKADPGSIENEELARQLFPEPEAEPDALPGISGKVLESAGISGLARARGNETKGNETKGSEENAREPRNAPGPTLALDADPPDGGTSTAVLHAQDQGTSQRLDDTATAHDPAHGSLPPDSSMLLGNHPELCEAAKHLLPEWTQPQRDALVCQIGIACRDPATSKLLGPDRWPALLTEHTPTLDQRSRPDWWVSDRVMDARKAAEASQREVARARASPTGRRTQAPTPAEDLGPSRAVKL